MYKRKDVTKLTGREPFLKTSKKFTVLDFWRYGFSNLNSNVIRGILAEFLVEQALKDDADIGLRNPWDDFDVGYMGAKIEVKCCSYLQDWNQEKLSTIQWSGLKAKTIYWYDTAGENYKDEKKEYKADIYILSLLDHRDPDTLDILDMDQWRFFVLSKGRLREVSGDSGSVSLARLTKHGVDSIGFNDIRHSVEALLR